MPASADSSGNTLPLLQKQLILAQAQILELEDVRDELQSALDERIRLGTQLQSIADQASVDRRAAERDREALQHDQDRLLADLQSARDALATAEQALDAARDQHTQIETRLRDAQARASQRAERIGTLEAELRAMKASRSWRWMAPVRSIERAWRRKP